MFSNQLYNDLWDKGGESHKSWIKNEMHEAATLGFILGCQSDLRSGTEQNPCHVQHRHLLGEWVGTGLKTHAPSTDGVFRKKWLLTNTYEGLLSWWPGLAVPKLSPHLLPPLVRGAACCWGGGEYEDKREAIAEESRSETKKATHTSSGWQGVAPRTGAVRPHSRKEDWPEMGSRLPKQHWRGNQEHLLYKFFSEFCFGRAPSW